MTLPDLPPPTIVAEARELEGLLEDLGRQKEIAFDTEADSFYSYREKVCLVQISTPRKDYLVDPLAGLDLEPLGKVLADPRRIKVFHDGEYDISILKRDWGFRFANLFDTRVAAAALGTPSPGLASVLAERFGVELDKSMQRSNWAKRPLNERQISYARLDTHFLLRLMREQKKELERRGRMMIVESECRRLERLEPVESSFQPEEFVRVKGARDLDPGQRRALRELFILREKFAERTDSPPFRVMSNQLLLELARTRPRALRKLTEIKGFTPRMASRIGDEVLKTIGASTQMPPIARLPRLPKKDGTSELSEIETELYDRLKKLRKSIAEKDGIESSYLLNRKVLLRIAKSRPATPEALSRVEGIQDWQRELYGADLLDVVRTFEKDLKAGEVPTRRSRQRR